MLAEDTCPRPCVSCKKGPQYLVYYCSARSPFLLTARSMLVSPTLLLPLLRRRRQGRHRAVVDMPSWNDGESSKERLGVSDVCPLVASSRPSALFYN
jgi:hypothetical protein